MALVPFRDPRTGGSRSVFDREGGLLGNLSLLELLDNTRKRIVRALLAVAIGALVAFTFINQIMSFLLAPARQALPAGNRLIYTQPGEAFGLYIQVALIIGIVFSLPFMMYQFWQLISPIVAPSVKRFAIPFACSPRSGSSSARRSTTSSSSST